jgi:hypothetical protein
MEVAPSEAKGGVRESIVIVILRMDTIFRKPSRLDRRGEERDKNR